MTATSGIATKRTWSDVRLETAFRGKGEQAASAICKLGPWDVIVGDHFRSFWLRKKSQGSSDNAVCKAPGGGQHEWNAASRQPFPPVRAGAKADHPDRRNRHDARSAERIRPAGERHYRAKSFACSSVSRLTVSDMNLRVYQKSDS
jgi:hypothetical protein